MYNIIFLSAIGVLVIVLAVQMLRSHNDNGTEKTGTGEEKKDK